MCGKASRQCLTQSRWVLSKPSSDELAFRVEPKRNEMFEIMITLSEEFSAALLAEQHGGRFPGLATERTLVKRVKGSVDKLEQRVDNFGVEKRWNRFTSVARMLQPHPSSQTPCKTQKFDANEGNK